MRSLGEAKKELDTLIEGFMVPIMYRIDPLTGQRLNGLGPDDFRRCLAGYGCPECLAKFTTYLVTCPVCGFKRDLGVDAQAPPQLWVDHLADRAAGRGTPAPLSIDQVIKEITEDKDVEHIPLSKLKLKRKNKQPRRDVTIKGVPAGGKGS